MKKIRFYKITYPLLALLLIATTLWSASIMGAYASTDGTAEAAPVCGIVEHTHTEDCSTTQQTLICGLDENATHTHEGTCYNYEDKLVCTQAVVEAHTHSDACYATESTVSCGKEETAGHTHRDGCYEAVTTQTCGKEAHIHDASCQTETKSLICTQTEVEAHTHGDACYIEEESLTCTTAETAGHKHGDDCYEFSLTCTNTEEGHIHDTACYTKTENLICGLTEHDAHTHGEGCYTKTTTLNCDVAETTGHTHSDACYTTESTVSCGKEVHEHDASCQTTENNLICQQSEVAAHSHDTSCYTETKTLSCDKEETAGHTHGENCYQLQATTLLCTIHVHLEDCYKTETKLTCALTEHTHSEGCYESVADVCEYCGVELVENAVHVKGCLTYCNCNFVEGGEHAENCLIHCTCDQEKGVHQSGCALYKETTIESSYGVTVFGALPETAELVVQPLLEADLTDFTLEANEFLAFAYDISIMVDGTEYQPTGEVTVTIDLPDGYRDLCDVTCASELIDVLTLYHLHSSRTESVDFYADDEADTLTFMVSGFSEFAAVVIESDPWGTVTIGTSVYTINSRVTLVDANLALLKNEAMGTHEDAVADEEISAVFGANNEYAFSGFDEVYGAVYELLLAKATKTLDAGSEIAAAGISGTEIWNISGDVKIVGKQTLSTSDRLIVVAEDSSACLILANTVSSFSLASSSAILSVQGQTGSVPISIKGNGSVLEAFAIQNNGGSLYLYNTDIASFTVASGDSYAIIGFGSKNDIARYMYMSHSSMHDISGVASPGIFCRAYTTSSNTNNVKSRLWLYDNDFYNCVSTGSGSTKGGAVIRSYAADNCQLRAELCRFTNNQAKSSSTDASGGGAVYWKSAAGSAEFENCTFTNNRTNSVGGAIYNTGTMTINKCTFVGNYAKLGGGAIAVEPPRTNTHYASIDTQNLSGSLTLDSQTLLQNNTTDAYGGGIYFYGIKGTNGTDTEKNAEDIKTYDMFLTIDGATITENTARDGGGVAMKLEHDAYLYETGIVINSGSMITNNIATQNGGAIWMYAAANCDVTNSEGIVMSGGKAYDNSAKQYGGTVYMSSASSAVSDMNFLMAGGTLENSTASDGGAVYMKDGIFTMSDGLISMGKATESGGGVYLVAGTFGMSGGEIQDCTATNLGGAIYLGGGDMIVSGGSITENTSAYGGGAYLGGGDMIVSGGSITSNTAKVDGGGAFVSSGELNISGGSISNNKAANNGGGACVKNGTVIMSGGTVDNNTATNGAGGGMYVSASDYNASVTIYSGSITNNSAGTSGGAVAVVGTTGGDETITITVTLGVNEDHSTLPFTHPKTETGPYYQHKSCPVIENNASFKSGGALYITGGDETHLNIYCLLEKNNQAGDGDSLSNCMMVEGGTVNISSSDPNTGLGSDHGNTEINGTVHVLGGSVLLGGNTGGDVTLSGATSNPKFNSAITVDVTETGGSFIDNRVSDTYYKLLYFENFLALAASTPTGQYTAYQFPKNVPLTISGSIYSHPGYTILGWCTTDTINGGGTLYDVGSTYPQDGDPYDDLTLYAIWKMNGYTVKFHPNVPSGEAYTGTMEPQQFTYNVEEPLASNVFEYPGYIFTGWLASNGNTYADGANILNLTTKDGAVIDFYATWAKCLHDGALGTYFVYTADGNMLTRECTCGGQTLTVKLSAEDAVYDGTGHPVQVVYSDENWTLAVVYTKDGADFSGTPTDAGTYIATVTDGGKTASVTYTIAKADQDPPDVPTFTVNEDTLTVTPVDPSPKAVIDEGIKTYYQLFYYVGGTEYSSAASTDTVFAFDVSYTSYYVKVWYSEGVNHKASEKVRSTQTYFFNEGDTQIRFVVGTGILCSVVENPDQNVGGLVITVDPDEGYYLTSDFSVTKNNNKGDTSEIITKDVHKTYLLQSIPNVKELEIVVTIDGAAKQATPQATVTEKQVFGNVTGTSATISQDSAFTAYYSVSNYDTTAYSGLKLDFSPAAPAGTTIILLNKSDGSYWSYTVPSGGASSVALTAFTRMGSTEPFSISGTNLSYQFIVDFSRVSGDYISGTLSMTLSGDKTNANVPVLTASVTVTLVAQSSFAFEKQSTDDGLTQTFKLNYTASDGASSRWDNRKTSLVLTPDAPLPADASLLVTLKNGEKIDWSMSGNGSYIIPLSAVGSETVTAELLSSLFPVKRATYTFKVQWIVSNSAAAKAPMNGYECASMGTVVFTKAETVQHAMKATGSTRLLPISSTEPLEVTVTYQIPAGAVGYTVTAELLRKGDGSEYISTAWNRTITSSGHVLEVSLTGLGLPPGSYCLMLTMAADSGASTILQVPYYFIAE